MLRLIAAVEAAKVPGGKKRDQERASAACKDAAYVAQSKIADVADEDIADDDIEKTQSTLTVDEERPCPGGLANGL
jgi:hypothetical protein